MKIEDLDSVTTDKYESFKLTQKIISELKKGDKVILTVNDEEVFNSVVLYGISTHINILLQDKGEKTIELTPEQVILAIAEYKEKLQ